MTVDLSFTRPIGPDDGEYLLLGHSLGTSATIWDEAARLLEPHFQVIRWELPGHGNAAPASGPFSVEDVADAIVAHVASLGGRSFAHAGVSFGGVVGIDLAVRCPDAVRATAVISAGANVDIPSSWLDRAAGVRAHGTGSLAEGSRERWFAPASAAAHPDTVDRLISALVATQDEDYARACEALAAYDVREGLGEVEVPLLALWGEYDRLVPETKSAELAAGVRHGRVQRIDGAAHAAPAERPADVARRLIEFLGR